MGRGVPPVPETELQFTFMQNMTTFTYCAFWIIEKQSDPNLQNSSGLKFYSLNEGLLQYWDKKKILHLLYRKVLIRNYSKISIIRNCTVYIDEQKIVGSNYILVDL